MFVCHYVICVWHFAAWNQQYPNMSVHLYGTSAAGLSESSCLLHESRTNIIVRMDLRSLVELAHVSAGRAGMREELDRPRRPPTGGARGFSGLLPLAARPAGPSRLQRGWMRPAPGFARRPSPLFPPVTKLSRTTVTEGTRLGRELNCASEKEKNYYHVQ